MFRKHRITAVNLGNGVWAASCRYCGTLGQGNDVYISYIVAIHQGNHLATA